MPRHLRAGWRLLRLLVHALWGLWLVAWRFPRLSSDQQQARVQAWSLGLLTCAGITLQLRGRPDFAKLDEVARLLLEERANRFRPGADTLVVAAWNGWMISSLVTGLQYFNSTM